MIRAIVVFQLCLIQKPFTAYAVKSLVFFQIYLTLIINFFQYLLNTGFVLRISCTNKLVVLNMQMRPQFTKFLADFVRQIPVVQYRNWLQIQRSFVHAHLSL